MARKREIKEPIRGPSPKELKEWNKRLAETGLTSEKGRDPRLVYVGGASDVEWIAGAEGKAIESTRTTNRDEDSGNSILSA